MLYKILFLICLSPVVRLMPPCCLPWSPCATARRCSCPPPRCSGCAAYNACIAVERFDSSLQVLNCITPLFSALTDAAIKRMCLQLFGAIACAVRAKTASDGKARVCVEKTMRKLLPQLRVTHNATNLRQLWRAVPPGGEDRRRHCQGGCAHCSDFSLCGEALRVAAAAAAGGGHFCLSRLEFARRFCPYLFFGCKCCVVSVTFLQSSTGPHPLMQALRCVVNVCGCGGDMWCYLTAGAGAL
jgi:hypothetical protein